MVLASTSGIFNIEKYVQHLVKYNVLMHLITDDPVDLDPTRLDYHQELN